MLLRPQLPTARSIRPSPSKSPPTMLVHHPVRSASPQVEVISSSLPLLFRNTRTGPHSSASARSGHPSRSRSTNVAPLTSPIDRNGSLNALDTFNSPFSFSHIVDDTGSGYRPGANRPPTNRSRSPSPSMSASAIGPML